MANKHYSDFIEISPTFESVVDIDADSRNKNLWREYIVGEDMEELMKVLCLSLNKEEPDSRRSFWIEGNYGTGKSYAAIVIKHLMEEQSEVIDDFLARNSRLSPYRNRFMKSRAKDKGDYLVIWKTGCTGIRDGNAILIEAELAIRKALIEKFGEKADFGDFSLRDAVMQQINSPVHNWDYIIETTDLGDDYSSFNELRANLESGNLYALQKTAEVIRKFNWGLVDSLETFKKWIAAVIQNNGLSKSGIFFIWDEFTEYVVNSDDQTILQQLSEYCKVQPFFMMFVVHRTSEMIDRLTPERYQLITHRFHQVQFHISTDAAFDLIAGSINIRAGMGEHWKEERKGVLKNIQSSLPDIAGIDDSISEQIEHLCPMHPMTIKLLSRVAENYAAAQRTMFRFMKDQADAEHGFVGYIHKYGPDDQACWLTPEWLWDYFFTRESDYADKDFRAADYIHHYQESKYLVEKDENAHRVFKTAMLLLAVMSSTKGIYSGRRARSGISATKECLENCLAGVMDRKQVEDLLATMVDSKILVLDESSNKDVRLQLPFSKGAGGEFEERFAANDKKYSRYMMFSKDGVFSQAFEKEAWDDNDPCKKRMKLAVCCAETNSIKTRLGEVQKELEKFPYKLGLLIVTVQSDAQANTIQSILHDKACELEEPRLTIALVKNPFTDENRKLWLTAITKQELAADSGQTGSISQFKAEAERIIATWVRGAISAGKIIAYNGTKNYPNLFGMTNLSKIIKVNVRDAIFGCAPENIVITNTAYKTCNDSAPIAGIQRKSTNSQLQQVLNSLRQAGLLDLTSIDEVVAQKNSEYKQAKCVASVAELVKTEMESGGKVDLDELWSKLQNPPFGYYNTIACGVLLGYIFSFYKDSKYTWTDGVQSPHVLAEVTVGRMVSTLCAGKMTTDYLSAGTVTWQNFSEYLEKIFGLSVAQLAEQTSGYQNVREAVSKNGTPFWVLKYLPSEDWNNEELRETATKVVDDIQLFILQDGDVEAAMSDALQLLKGKGKIRVVLGKAFQDKNAMAAAFRRFLYDASPELNEVASRLSIQPQELSDRLHSVMENSIYTWTEESVRLVLPDIAGQYRFLEVISKVQGTTYHSIEQAQKDLFNQFKYLRIPMKAISKLNKPWYTALEILYNVALVKEVYSDAAERESAIDELEQYGELAKAYLEGGKTVLEEILVERNLECTKDELTTVYDGLKEMSCDTNLSQFNKELDNQLEKISFARNKKQLWEMWRFITGKDSVKLWCDEYGVPLLWIVPKELNGAFTTLLDVQNGNATNNQYVISAYNALDTMDETLLTDPQKIQSKFVTLFGDEYSDILEENHKDIISQAKFKFGNDMSIWTFREAMILQGMLKEMKQEKAKKEKLIGTKNQVNSMKESILRNTVSRFLDAHPEFCDEFLD